MADEVDALLAAMGGESSPPPPERAAPAPAHPAPAPPRGPERLAGAASELWNPAVRWSTGAVAGVAGGRAPSAHTDVLRQKAVRALQARFKGLCEQLNTGWDDFATNQNFERWLLDRKTAAPGGDPLLPSAKAAADDPGLRKELFASARLQRRAVQRFMADLQKAVAKAHRTLAQLAGTGSQKRRVRVAPAAAPAAAAHEPAAAPRPALGWDGAPMLQLKYGSSAALINQCHWDKLAAMHALELGQAASAPAEKERFAERVFCLLVRYNALQGGGVHGGGFQAAVPAEVFDVLLAEFGVCFECFASPLNSRYPRFCSAFPDTDGPFGSVGSFFSFEPTEGSFEANPPFVPQLILRFVRPVACLCFAPLSELCAQTAWRSTCTGCSRLRTARRPAVAVVGITLCASL